GSVVDADDVLLRRICCAHPGDSFVSACEGAPGLGHELENVTVRVTVHNLVMLTPNGRVVSTVSANIFARQLRRRAAPATPAAPTRARSARGQPALCPPARPTRSP